MNATFSAVNASHAEVHPRWPKNKTMNVVIAPNPTPLSARASPGFHTARATPVNAARARVGSGIGRINATNVSVTSGISMVASAIATKPCLAYNAVPIGAPTANAA